MIPVLCLFEIVFDNIRYSRDTKLSIVVVLMGVGVCTVTDVSLNTKGFIAALVAVWSTALQQYVSSNFTFIFTVLGNRKRRLMLIDCWVSLRSFASILDVGVY